MNEPAPSAAWRADDGVRMRWCACAGANRTRMREEREMDGCRALGGDNESAAATRAA